MTMRNRLRAFSQLSVAVVFACTTLNPSVAMPTQPCPDGTDRTAVVALPVALIVLGLGVGAAVLVWRSTISSLVRWTVVPVVLLTTLVVAV